MAKGLRRTVRTILGAALVAFLASCTEDLPKPNLPDRLMLERFSMTGEFLGQESLGPQYQTHKNLQALLLRERSGWRVNYIAYAVPRYVFRSRSMIIRCHSDRLVIDLPRKGSYTKKIDGVYRALGLD
jgi:hypothetical protein